MCPVKCICAQPAPSEISATAFDVSRPEIRSLLPDGQDFKNALMDQLTPEACRDFLHAQQPCIYNHMLLNDNL